ncbi:recombinase family protein [Clostridium ljungdahlii]|uniref:Transposon gamma-delta resolvase n=1 Tax=Clostridium ljungdahlii TaxID=1538 RepID=A0A168LQV9_9CLOT|nr:recombinase family protein [Clostridium ljungdahlii]OAA83574.1 Transposon gamma-delta resolvase [Clostridium ljungdahlii]
MREVTNKNRKVAIYGRVSSEHESQLSAFANQIKWYDAQAERHPEWEIVEKYFDKGITGTQARKRPSFLKMINDADQGKFDLIVTREVSRFARNTLDALKYTRQLKEHGIEVRFLIDDISTFDCDGETRLTNMAAYAQDESRKISERVKAGQYIARHEKGVLYGSGNILGYNRLGKTFIIDDEQAETVRMIFRMYLDGYGLRLIKTELLKKGRKNSKDQVKWFESTISRMLENPMYIGKQYQNKTYVKDFLDHKIVRNDKINYLLIDGKFEPIISVEDFEKVAAIKKRRVKKNPGQNPYGIKTSNDKWINLLECNCGSRFQQYKWRKDKKTGKIKKGYACRNRINNGRTEYRKNNNLPLDGVCDRKTICDWHLELMIKDILEEIWGFRKESVIKAFELIKDNFVDDNINNVSTINKLNSKILRYKKKISVLTDLYTDGDIIKRDFIDNRDQYNGFIKTAESEIKRIDGGVGLEKKNLENKLQHIKKVLEQLIDFNVEQLDDSLIRQLVDKVIVRSDNKFEWLLNISGGEMGDVFSFMLNEKLDIKRQKSIETRDTKYTLAFSSIISFDRARAYRKQYNKYLRKNQWTDINYEVYVR